MTPSTARPFLLLKSVAGNSVADGAEGSLGVFRGCCCDKEQVRSVACSERRQELCGAREHVDLDLWP
jgi:hypothetical protein